MLWAVVAQVETLTKQGLPPNHAVAAAVAPSIFLVPVDNKHEERGTKYSPNATGAPHLVRKILEVLLRNGKVILVTGRLLSGEIPQRVCVGRDWFH